MGRRNPPAKWVLPEVINPPDSICMTLQVPNERFHIAAFRGALLDLASAYKWQDDPDHKAREVASVWKGVIANMASDCEDATCCRDFPTSSTFIEWHPQNPYTQPDFTPAGYLLPPFYQVTPASFPDLIGYQAGDILTDISRIPVGTGVIIEPESGWARYRVNLKGTGICTLQMLNVPLGGYALVTSDDNPLSAVFVELNLDLIDLPPENNMVVGVERRFTTAGDHHIDVTFLPRFNDEAPAVFYGGDLRAVTICGFGEMMFDIRQKEDEPCIIEKTSDGTTWVDAVDMTLCPVNVRINLGLIQWFNPLTGLWETTDGGDERTDGTYDPPWPVPPVGQSLECLTAENITAIYQTGLTQVRAGVEAGLIAASIAAGLTGLMTAFIPSAIFGAISLAITSAALALGVAGLDDMLDSDSLGNFKCCILSNAQSDGTITSEGFTAIRECMATWASSVELLIIQNWLDGLGSVGLNRMANAAGIVSSDCVECEWCHTYDLAASDGGGVLAGLGTYVSSTGWQTTYGVAGGGYRALDYKLILPASRLLTRIVVYFDYTQGAVAGGSGENAYSLYLNNYATLIHAIPIPTVPTSPQDESLGAGIVADEIDLHFIAGFTTGGSDPSGVATNWRVTVYGKGVNPFGADNC